MLDHPHPRAVSLREIISESSPLPPTRAVDLAAQAATALDAMHEAGVVHGSVRPETVLVADDRTVSIDEASVLTEDTDDSTQDLQPADANEVSYFSPEQVQGLETDGRTDLYSLGVILFEMLTGSVPFKSTSATAAAFEHVSQPAPRVDAIDPEIPREVADTVEKALAKDPEERYESGAAMAVALTGVLGLLARAQPAVFAGVPGQAANSASDSASRWRKFGVASILLLVASLSAAGVVPLLPGPATSGDEIAAASSDPASEQDDRAGTRSSPQPGFDRNDSNDDGSPPSSNATSGTTTTTDSAREPTTTVAPESPTTTATSPSSTSPTSSPTTSTSSTSTTSPTTSTTTTSTTTTTTTTTSTTTTSTTTTTTTPTTTTTEPSTTTTTNDG